VAKTPYFAQAILSLVPREVPNGTLSEHGTFAVSKQGVMLYEPAALARWTTPEAGSVIIHEVMHWLREHADRREAMSADAKLFNLAGDCEINDDLALMRLPLPDGGGVQPHTFKLPINKTAEEYYRALVQQREDEKKRRKAEREKAAAEEQARREAEQPEESEPTEEPEDSDGDEAEDNLPDAEDSDDTKADAGDEDGAGDGEADEDDSSDGADSEGDGGAQEGEGDEPGSGDGVDAQGQTPSNTAGIGEDDCDDLHPNPRCGGCAGNPGDAEPEDDPQGRKDSEVAVLKQATALAIQQHAKQHGVGSVPAGMVRWAEKLTTPAKVMWQQKLAMLGRSAVARRAGATDYTFNRVSRRQAGYGFGVGKMIAPALISRQPNVVIALDTSGSMGQSEVNRAVTEAEAIMRSIGGEVHLIACDCRVHATMKVKTVRELLAQIKGGGGTDFRPVFEELSNLRPEPDVMIFITDGGGWAPEFPPGKTKVIWLLVGAHRMKPMIVSTGPGYKSVGYGDFIEVDE
jgi:predicted metal-dependent peptidase